MFVRGEYRRNVRLINFAAPWRITSAVDERRERRRERRRAVTCWEYFVDVWERLRDTRARRAPDECEPCLNRSSWAQERLEKHARCITGGPVSNGGMQQATSFVEREALSSNQRHLRRRVLMAAPFRIKTFHSSRAHRGSQLPCRSVS